jgi:hypothetical protein
MPWPLYALKGWISSRDITGNDLHDVIRETDDVKPGGRLIDG